VPEQLDHLDARCARCGRTAFCITVRDAPLVTIMACPRCERRSWRVDGVHASIADVVRLVQCERRLRLLPRA
jgi:hypothetical protein